MAKKKEEKKTIGLETLRPPRGSRHRKVRVGRGIGSKLGKTSGSGNKGQKSRRGYSRRRGFEGGQMPLHRRIPKRGFNNARFATVYLPVNVSSLNDFEDGARVDELALRACGLASGKSDGVKILGDGELNKKLTVCTNAFSASARAKIEAKGGKCELVVAAKAGASKA